MSTTSLPSLSSPSQPQKYIFPLPTLSNSRLALTPFDLSLHAAPFVAGTKNHPELLDYISAPSFQTVAEFDDFFRPRMLVSESDAFWAVYAKGEGENGIGEEGSGGNAEQGVFAGMIGLINSSATDGVVEIGFIIILPTFHGTYVASNAAGLLLHYALDPPAIGGLGLRRCQWQCHALNTASRNVALRMGFTLEGVMRLQRTVLVGKEGNGVVRGESVVEGLRERESRDTCMFAHYCDEWSGEGGKREHVRRIMERRVSVVESRV